MASDPKVSPVSALVQRLEPLYAAILTVVGYRDHARGCEIDQTDFCSCGLREAVDRLDREWKSFAAALRGGGSSPDVPSADTADFYEFTTGGDARTILRRLAQLIGSKALLYREPDEGGYTEAFTAADRKKLARQLNELAAQPSGGVRSFHTGEMRRATAERIAADLFWNSNFDRAERLVLTAKDGSNLGGWSEHAVANRIVAALSAPSATPPPATETQFVWLMERTLTTQSDGLRRVRAGTLVYWDGGHAESFTTDVLKAVHWPTKEAAKQQCPPEHYAQWGWRYVEHGFMASRGGGSSPTGERCKHFGGTRPCDECPDCYEFSAVAISAPSSSPAPSGRRHEDDER